MRMIYLRSCLVDLIVEGRVDVLGNVGRRIRMEIRRFGKRLLWKTSWCVVWRSFTRVLERMLRFRELFLMILANLVLLRRS
ncbi:hypothetical protein CsSME_00043721 [Camellia sinensis var. sinensis]